MLFFHLSSIFNIIWSKVVLLLFKFDYLNIFRLLQNKKAKAEIYNKKQVETNR